MLRCSKTQYFWYTARSRFSGSISCDILFTGKCASESSCGQSHLGSARGGATAARGRTTELMGTLILTLLSWKATWDKPKHVKKHRTGGRQSRQGERERGGRKVKKTQQYETQKQKKQKANRRRLGGNFKLNLGHEGIFIKKYAFYTQFKQPQPSNTTRWQCWTIMRTCV